MASKIWRRMGILSVLAISGVVGCTTQQPLISHAHVGHALTTWHDTPGQQGLMEVAAADLRIAEREARMACSNALSGSGTAHTANVIYALVPEAQRNPEFKGPGSGYGAVRALMGTVEHLEYAATSADASLNLVTAVAQLSLHGETVHARLEVATELAQTMLSAPSAEFADHCSRLQQELRVALHGGVVGPRDDGFSTIGFNALHAEVLATLRREQDPAYEPVPRRYVLGLVRLPSGEWQYRLPRSTNQMPTRYGY
ncbi:MAG: hypothetical protein ACR2QZ_03610 [Woeseiaceae bacterium]